MQKLRTTLLFVLLVVVFLLAFTLTAGPHRSRQDFDDFAEQVEAGNVSVVRVDGNSILVDHWDGYAYEVLGVLDDDMTRHLSELGVVIEWGPESRPLRKFLMIAMPLILFLSALIYFIRKAQAGGAQNILTMRKSTARLVGEGQQVRFDDVGGCEEAKEQLQDVIDFLRDPAPWTASGVRLPRGVLLEGPPGCGKTLLARAVAGETDAKFYLVSGSEFVEMFVGVGAARVRDTFDTAAKEAPAVLFIDEIDAVGRRRGSGVGASNDEREQTLNQILVCMDGFEHKERVVVIAATNRADVLDSALLRPGRFDRRIAVPLLSREQRLQVLAIHCRNKTLAEGVSLDELASRSAGQNGAQLESLVNEAGLLAVRRANRQPGAQAALTLQDFDDALAQRHEESQRFDAIDALLVESTTQLSQATGKARVRLTLLEGTIVEGELIWADAAYLKLRAEDAEDALLVSKQSIKTVEALDGTEWVDAEDVHPDRNAGRTPGLA